MKKRTLKAAGRAPNWVRTAAIAKFPKKRKGKFKPRDPGRVLSTEEKRAVAARLGLA